MRPRLTYANVVSSLALFLVLGGGAAFAVDGPLPGQNQVGSADIINNDVRSEDIRDANLTTADIRGLERHPRFQRHLLRHRAGNRRRPDAGCRDRRSQQHGRPRGKRIRDDPRGRRVRPNRHGLLCDHAATAQHHGRRGRRHQQRDRGGAGGLRQRRRLHDRDPVGAHKPKAASQATHVRCGTSPPRSRWPRAGRCRRSWSS
jgi:hypothetical protein